MANSHFVLGFVLFKSFYTEHAPWEWLKTLGWRGPSHVGTRLCRGTWHGFC